jgi:hypothetical protein
MKALKRATSILPAIAILAIPSPALGDYLIPPGNSAATQYTEAYPTAGGSRKAERGDKQQNRPPAEVIGERTASELESRGPDGRAAAEVAAATAPAGGLAISADAGAGVESGGSQGGEGRAAAPGDEADAGSGVGEVLGQATGSSSSGELGPLLPLTILAAIAWALFYVWWQRRRRAA